MAGFFIVFDKYESMLETMRTGVYSTFLKEGSSTAWYRIAEGTMADFASMRAGDSLFFFSDRQVYGRGRLVSIRRNCRMENFCGSSALSPADHATCQSDLLWDSGLDGWERYEKKNKTTTLYTQRWICTFEPYPRYWAKGVDMDDLLDSNPEAFRVVRSMAAKTFTKVDDQEEQAFVAALVRANADDESSLVGFDDSVHKSIRKSCSKKSRPLDFSTLLGSLADGTQIRHEMAVEAALVRQIADRHPPTVKVLGDWHHVSRQVPASPHKPSRWMDFMDLFGYSYLPGYEGQVVGRFYIGEVKLGAAEPGEVEQAMRYVDWVKDQYADKDYSLVRAFLIAHSFPPETRERAREVAKRLYTVRRRPAETSEWDGLALVEYRYRKGTGLLYLRPVSLEA